MSLKKSNTASPEVNPNASYDAELKQKQTNKNSFNDETENALLDL